MADLQLTHLYRAPLGPNPGKPPLLVLLHGVGSNERDLFSLAGELDPRYAVVSVRAPHQRFPGSYAWFEVQMGGGTFVIDPEMEEHSRGLLTAFLPEAAEVYGADLARIHLAGFSQGAIMSMGIMLTRPDLVAAVVAMSGRILPEVLPLARPVEELAGFPILVVHGTHDAVIPVSYGRDAREILSKLPVDLTYEEFPMGHEVSGASLRVVADWLTARLDTSP